MSILSVCFSFHLFIYLINFIVFYRWLLSLIPTSNARVDITFMRQVNRDYSMESAHERFLFTNCDASDKRTSEFFDASL